MITNIQISGFKTFLDFELEMAPFQVIIGPNGAGKSNLFEALRFLSLLAEEDLPHAFQQLQKIRRGEPFTILPDGKTISQMKFSVDLLVEPTVSNGWGKEVPVEHRRLRYTLIIERYGEEQELRKLRIAYESLEPILPGTDGWLRKYIQTEIELKPTSTLPEFFFRYRREQSNSSLYHYRSTAVQSAVQEYEPTDLRELVLRRMHSTETPAALAVLQELQSWKFFHLQPRAISEPSPVELTELGEDGTNLATAVAAATAQDPFILNDISRGLANLVPGLIKIQLDRNKATGAVELWGVLEDGRTIPPYLLSDGTLRILALLYMANGPEYHGTVCFEEPENGIYPGMQKAITDLLFQLTSYDVDSGKIESPLRQVLLNTHSPVIVGHITARLTADAGNYLPDIARIAFAETVTRVQPDVSAPFGITRMTPVQLFQTAENDTQVRETEGAYSVGQALRYLESVDFSDLKASLRKRITP